MDPRIRDTVAPADPRIGRAAPGDGAGALDPRIRRGPTGKPAGAPAPAGPSLYDPGNLPDPGPGFPGGAPAWWDPTARRHACPENLPGEYHRQQVGKTYRPLLNSAAEVHAIGGSLLATADRENFEGRLAKFMAAYDVPNAALAALDGDGRLVHCTGLTNLTVYQQKHLQPAWAGPHSSFRVGSVSKTFTAWAIMKLADLGIVPDMQARLRAHVDLKRFPRAVSLGLVSRELNPLSGPRREAAWRRDERRDDITLAHLLTHRGGWFDTGYEEVHPPDRDPIVRGVYPEVYASDFKGNPGNMDKGISRFDAEIAATNRATWPVTHDHMLRYFNLWPLAFKPGSHYSYSNLGYWMLGRVVESASCRGYESFVREALLRPLGMRDTRVGPDLSTERGVGEMPVFGSNWPGSGAGTRPSRSQSYQDAAGAYDATDLEDYEPYAQRRLRLLDASGGWLSSAYDLALYMRETFYRQSLFEHNVWYREMLRFQGMRSAEDGMGYGWESGGSQGRGAWFKTGHLDGGAAEVAFEGTSRVSRNLSLIVMHNRWKLTGDTDIDDDIDHEMRSYVMKALRRVSLPTGRQDLLHVLPP